MDEGGGISVRTVKIEIEEMDDLVSDHCLKTSTPLPKQKFYKSSCLKKLAKKPGKKPFYYVQKFRKEWLDEKEFQPWLEESKDDISKGYCMWCERHLHARLHELKRHMKTRKHQLVAQQRYKEMAHLGPILKTKSTSREEEQKNQNFKTYIIDLLKDISAIRSLSDEESRDHEISEEKENDRSQGLDLAPLVKEQCEKTNLLNAFLNIQQERLELDRCLLENTRKSEAIQEGILEVIQTKWN